MRFLGKKQGRSTQTTCQVRVEHAITQHFAGNSGPLWASGRTAVVLGGPCEPEFPIMWGGLGGEYDLLNRVQSQQQSVRNHANNRHCLEAVLKLRGSLESLICMPFT